MAALKVGERASGFDLPAVTGESIHRVRLSDYQGQKHVVMAFHPINWTPI